MAHFRMPGEAINYFWTMSGNFIYRHHVEPRVKLYSPREESFPIPLKYGDASRTTHTNLDVKQERGSRSWEQKEKQETRSVGSDSRSSRRIKPFKKSFLKAGVKKLLRAGVVPARTWRVRAVEMAPTERLKLRRQMAAAAGKNSATSIWP